MAGRDHLCELFATVPTGFESGAADEIREVLGREAVPHRGKISFQLATIEELHKVDQLKAIDNYYVIVKEFANFCQDESTVLQRLEGLPGSELLDLSVGLSVWKYHREKIEFAAGETKSNSQEDNEKELQCRVAKEVDVKTQSVLDPATSEPQSPIPSTNLSESQSPIPSANLSESQSPIPPANLSESQSPIPSTNLASFQTDGEVQPTFRVTCTRAGRKHKFTSVQAAGSLGAGLMRHYQWKVQMKNADLEVLLHIMSDSAVVGIALSTKSRHKRNIVHFGPTTLRSTIAYGLLRLANIAPGEVVIDPLCGGASISIEGTMSWPSSFHLAGDVHELATPRAAANVRAVQQQEQQKQNCCGVKVDVFSWDACRLPLKTASVDVVVTDMPFGKRSGSKSKNWELYPAFLEEMGRVCRPSSSRAVLLTHDTKVIGRAMHRCAALWRRHKTIWINIGGLTAGVYILLRTPTIF